jgi:hypothetical protein
LIGVHPLARYLLRDPSGPARLAASLFARAADFFKKTAPRRKFSRHANGAIESNFWFLILLLPRHRLPVFA